MDYLVLIEKAGDNYCAHSPDVPGCVATGDTIEDTQENYRKSLELLFREMRKVGQTPPLPKTRGVTVQVDAP